MAVNPPARRRVLGERRAPVSPPALALERVSLATLRDHPRNYRTHPEDQLEHLCQSLRQYGLYRNVVIAQEGTLLAGHGVVAAARRLGWEAIHVVRLPLTPDEPAALKLLAADNELEHLADQDDRALTELLKEVSERDLAGLLGTGFDAMMLANLVYVTRPSSEIEDFNAAAHWVGMPDYELDEEDSTRCSLIFHFSDPATREQFCLQNGYPVPTARTASRWWPERERRKLAGQIVEEGT